MGTKITVSPFFCLILAGMLLTLPLPWVTAMLIAAGLHEGAHFLALRLCGRAVGVLQIGTGGASIPMPQLGRRQELLCALAGPASGLLLLFLMRWFPRLAVCGAVQSIYNLLPIYPLDGGRAVHCFFQLLLPPPTAKKFAFCVENICLLGILAAALYAWIVMGMGLLPPVIAFFLLFRAKSGKMPCKARGKQVQYPYSNIEV